MADIALTKASIRPLGPGVDFRATAGEAMTLGQPVYMSASDTVSLTDGSDATKSFCVGVVIGGADSAGDVASGAEVDVRAFGRVTGYSTNCAANSLACVDDDAGILSTATGTKSTVVGVCLNTTTIFVSPTIISLS